MKGILVLFQFNFRFLEVNKEPVSVTYQPSAELVGQFFVVELIYLRSQYCFLFCCVRFHILSYFWGLCRLSESGKRRFSAEEHEGQIGLSEDLLGGSGDS